MRGGLPDHSRRREARAGGVAHAEAAAPAGDQAIPGRLRYRAGPHEKETRGGGLQSLQAHFPEQAARRHRTEQIEYSPDQSHRHGQDAAGADAVARSEEHTSELQSLAYLVCRLLLEKKKNTTSGRVNLHIT